MTQIGTPTKICMKRSKSLINERINMALFYMEQGSSKQDACLAAGITAENLAYYTRRDPVLKRKVDLAMSKGGLRASNGSFFTRKPPPGRKKNVSLSEIQRKCDERLSDE